nr:MULTISPECIES: DUF550 domain-containing protein [Klebsiella]
MGYIDRGRETAYLWGKQNSEAGDVPLYRHTLPAPERDRVRCEHAEWSQSTFGNVGPIGPLKHLSKEALEAAADPSDLSEWADMQFLLWDAQRRAGITDEQITQAMIEKLAVNKQREWPEPKDGEPRLHIKDQPSAVGPVTDAMAYAFHHALTDGPLGDDDVEDIKTGLRAAFATVTLNQPAPVVLTFEEWCKRTGQKPQGWVCDAMKEAYEGANSPVIPDGYVMVPMRLTAENGAKGALSGEFSETQFVNCPECFGDDECETCDGSGRVEIKVPVSWTTIKAIWVKGVEHFATTITEE